MDDKNCGMSCASMMWWLTLLVAVLAVPSAAYIITLMFPVEGMVEIAVFIIACWVCTYLGMRLMSDPKIKDKLTFKK